MAGTKIMNLNVLLSARESHASYTALVAPVSGTFEGIVDGGIDYTAPMLNADGDVDTANPVTALLEEVIRITGVSTDATAVEFFWRKTDDPGSAVSVGQATETASGVWTYPIGYEAVQVGISLGATSAPWTGIEMNAKVTNPEGVVWEGWVPFTVSHVWEAESLPWPLINDPPGVYGGKISDCVSVRTADYMVYAVDVLGETNDNSLFDFRVDMLPDSDSSWATQDKAVIIGMTDGLPQEWPTSSDLVSLSKNNSGIWYITIRRSTARGYSDDWVINVDAEMAAFEAAAGSGRAQLRLVVDCDSPNVALYYRLPSVEAQRLPLNDDTNWQTISADVLTDLGGDITTGDWDARSCFVGGFADPVNDPSGWPDFDPPHGTWEGGRYAGLGDAVIYGYYFKVDGTVISHMNDWANIPVPSLLSTQYDDYVGTIVNTYSYVDESTGATWYLMEEGVESICFTVTW